MSEKRLIDANELADKVDESKYNNPHPQGMVRVNHRNEHDHFLRMILDAPTIDAVPVVHGQWIKTEQENGCAEWTEFECSVCGAVFNGNEWLFDEWKGCPVCLARMDGDS